MAEIKVNCPDFIHLRRLRESGQKEVSDTKQRLWINPEKNLAHCFRCEYKTRDAATLLAKLGIRSALGNPDRQELPKRRLRLPSEYRDTFSSHAYGRKAWDYLLRRHIPPERICAYEIGYCTSGSYAGRIIIPIYQAGELVSYQGRDFLGRENAPRYISAKKDDGADGDALFNLDRASASGIIVLVEGPFDALRLPQYAVALCGSNRWNARRRELLLAANPRLVVLALDNDDAGLHATEAIRRSLAGLSFKVALLRLPGKDLGGLTPALADELGRTIAARGSFEGNGAGGNKECLP